MGLLPSATPPKEVVVFALVTGVNHGVAAYGCRGGSLFDRREFFDGRDLGEAHAVVDTNGLSVRLALTTGEVRFTTTGSHSNSSLA